MIGVAARGRAVVGLGVAVASIAGRRGAFPMPLADDLSSWSRTPLAPDPAMAKLAPALDSAGVVVGVLTPGPDDWVSQ